MLFFKFWQKMMIFEIFIFFSAEDVGPMSMNLNLIINKPPPNKVITFRVKTGLADADVLDEANLHGFAQLSLTD